MKSDFFEIKKNVSFENAYEFSKPDETVITRIRDLILGINIRNGRLRIENILKDRKLIKYLNVDDLLFEVKNDLFCNFKEYSDEFSDVPIGFVYYLGVSLFCSNSVEIVQKIYHKERSDIGNMYTSFTIKSYNGYFYYWK
ncbi:MAG: hypothetical protein JNK27_00980 [Chitinophagaceae bacterium]|nr:hypothetical protein [Chitinophagaceae bacterium]